MRNVLPATSKRMIHDLQHTSLSEPMCSMDSQRIRQYLVVHDTVKRHAVLTHAFPWRAQCHIKRQMNQKYSQARKFMQLCCKHQHTIFQKKYNSQRERSGCTFSTNQLTFLLRCRFHTRQLGWQLPHQRLPEVNCCIDDSLFYRARAQASRQADTRFWLESLQQLLEQAQFQPQHLQPFQRRRAHL